MEGLLSRMFFSKSKGKDICADGANVLELSIVFRPGSSLEKQTFRPQSEKEGEKNEPAQCSRPFSDYYKA